MSKSPAFQSNVNNLALQKVRQSDHLTFVSLVSRCSAVCFFVLNAYLTYNTDDGNKAALSVVLYVSEMDTFERCVPFRFCYINDFK